MHRGKSALVACAATAALLGPVGIAAADGSAPASAPAASPSAKAPKGAGDGSRGLCKRAKRIDKRLDRALKRLKGPATVRGSVARLTKRVERAKKADHTEVQTFLDHKLTFRRSLVPTLEQRQKDLSKVQTWCAARGEGSGGGKESAK
ncbi:hypothetical protein [Streptomyces rhizosphaericus]|uniref:Spy/CpxP family protein refolding chaperone n=1 Tax=Streptomyces rhizosphaericus TaxID=114699 RepID=A0A6G4ARM0_9ACTN|nr:hypothetical protein [Streptomyces rhizosphaericus]NEW75888.1 hypothetical protein [Streptomyces rhizosphaericus]